MAATASGVGAPEESARSKRRLTLYSAMEAEHAQPSLFTEADLEDDPEIKALRALRPVTRGDCVDGQRPCAWISCRHHLGANIDEEGNLTLMAPDPTEMAETCALDFADRHESGAPLDAVSEAMNLSRERVSQIEHRGSAKIRLAMGRESIDE